MSRSSLQHGGVLLCFVLGVGLAEPASAQRTRTVQLGSSRCHYMPRVENRPRAMLCRIGNNLVLRADSTGVGEGIKPGPKLIVIGAGPCTMKTLSGHAPVQTCTVGDQRYVLDSTGVGEGSGLSAGSDSTGVGTGEASLTLDQSNCKWVTLPGTFHRVLQCIYGPLVIRIDSTGVGEGSIRTASRR